MKQNTHTHYTFEEVQKWQMTKDLKKMANCEHDYETLPDGSRICFKCYHRAMPEAVALGRLGGKAGRGASKARKVSSEQARKAALARWSKVKHPAS